MQSPHKTFVCSIVVALAALSCPIVLKADQLIFTGNLTSDGTSVGGGDVVIDPASINAGDPFSIKLIYNPAGFIQSGNTFRLTDASLSLKFDGYTFDYLASRSTAILFSTPGVFGPGTVSFQICTGSLPCDTSINDFINLYLAGTVTDLSTLASQANTLSGDPNASPSQFEFLRNFDDGSQTDLQGSLGIPAGSPVPEPSMPALLAAMAAVAGVSKALRQIAFLIRRLL